MLEEFLPLRGRLGYAREISAPSWYFVIKNGAGLLLSRPAQHLGGYRCVHLIVMKAIELMDVIRNWGGNTIRVLHTRV